MTKIGIAFGFIITAMAAQSSFEELPFLKASDVVPEALRKGSQHEIAERVETDGLWNTYNVQSPLGDFTVHGSYLLRQRIHELYALAELRKIGADGIEGFIRALESPHGKTRASAAQMMCGAIPTEEIVVDLLKKALGDPNRRVRSFAVVGLLSAEWGVDVSSVRRRDEFVPLAIPLLRDRSENVRSRAAQMLWQWPQDVPIDAAAEALLEARSPKARRMIQRLLRKVLEARRDCDANE